MPHVYLNYFAILAAAVGAFVLGALWYSPLLFAKAWTRAHGYTPEQVQEMQKGAAKAYVVSLLCYLAMATAMSVVVYYMDLGMLHQGLQLGVLVWAGFLAPLGLTALMFSRDSFTAWAIDAGYQLLYSLLMGVVVTLWR